MTTMQLTASVCSFCYALASKFKSIIKNWQFARQMSANRIVAEQLIHLGHHNQKEYDQILQRMNDATVNEYHEKY